MWNPKTCQSSSTVLQTFIKTERFSAHGSRSRNRVTQRELASVWYPHLISFLKLQNKSEIKYRFSIIEMKKNSFDLSLLIWINSYNLQEMLITNTILFHIEEREGFFIFLNIIIYFLIIISLYKYGWKITVYCSFYLEADFFCVTCHFFPPMTELQSDWITLIDLLVWDQNTQCGR